MLALNEVSTDTLINIITLIERVCADEVFATPAEAKSYLRRLASAVINPSGIVHHANIVVQKHSQRALLTSCSDVIEKLRVGCVADEDLQLLTELTANAGRSPAGGSVGSHSAPALTDGNTLRTTDYGKLRWCIEGLLHEGLVIYASMPKVGKSIHTLNMCVAIASGADYWGMKTYQSHVVYLGLEDSLRRLKDRLSQMTESGQDLSRLHLGTAARTIDTGFVSDVARYMKDFPDIGVIVVDVLQAVRGNNRKGRNAYEFDRHELSTLKHIADEYNIALVVIHHDSKMKPSKGVVDSFSGSRGITGSADLLLSAFSEPDNAKQARLFVKSREMESRCFLMQHSCSGSLEWDLVDTPDFSNCTEAQTSEKEYANPAELLLTELFADRDRVGLAEIKAKRDERKINKMSLNRARQKLCIKTTADKYGKTKDGSEVEWYVE